MNFNGLNLFILCLTISFGYSQSLNISFTVKLASPDLKIDCSYKMEKGEKFDFLRIKKNGNVFFKFTRDNPDEPDFTAVDGISAVDMSGGGRVTIKNYQNTTFGLFDCGVGYKINNMDKYSSKKLKINFQATCKQTWKNTTIDNIPTDAYVAGRTDGMNLYYCRFVYKDILTVGRVWETPDGQGCFIGHYGNAVKSTTFEILLGNNYQYTNMNLRDPYPPGSYNMGGDIFMGRCKKDGKTYIGHISNSGVLYRADTQKEYDDCPNPYEIMLLNSDCFTG